jgi:hypothetical protein
MDHKFVMAAIIYGITHKAKKHADKCSNNKTKKHRNKMTKSQTNNVFKILQR